jgi:hypothetical protein
MRRSFSPRSACSLAVLLLVAASVAANSAAGDKWDADWKKVDEAAQKGLPKTAIDALKPIIAGALKAKDYPQAIKAIGRKIAIEGQIQGNRAEERISRVAEEIATAPKPMLPVLNAIQAHWYWNYFQQNRWRFMQRTATAAPPGENIATWDLPRIYAEIDKQFALALGNAAELKAIPIGDYDALLERGTTPDSYRPTLYDFLAHDALSFYASGEQAAAKPEDAFELSADGPIFSSIDDFLAWDIKTSDETSPKVRALRLLQDLLKFPRADKDPSALADDDLERLRFGYNHAVGEEKNARYKAALKRFIEKWAVHELSAMGRAQLAGVLQSERSLVDARAVAAEGAKKFPNSNGGKLCHNIVATIEAKSIQITTERVWNQPWPAINVNYRNITEVHFRAIKVDWLARLKSNRLSQWLDENARKELLAEKPALEWSAKLPATDDFRDRLERLSAPSSLKPGFYFIIASADPKFSTSNNQLSFSDFWVSKLAIVVRTQWGSLAVEGFVLEADSGEPLADVEIQSWTREQNNQLTAGPSAKTDKNGLF